MDINDLFVSCRKGDIARVQYYACLCGHDEVVRYLLENGARCEANTFDGERCLYGALTSEIRTLLKSYKAVTSSTVRRDLYNEFLRKLLDRGHHSDIHFVVHGESFHLHRCVLAARSQYFAQMFKTKWDERDTVHLSHTLVLSWAFKHLLQFMYTGKLECSIDQIENVLILAKQCQMFDFITSVEAKLKSVLSFESTKPGVHVKMITLEPSQDCSDLQQDMEVLADAALPDELLTCELPFPPEHIDLYPDVDFSVESHHFHCHKAFFCMRSDYFKAAIEDNFGDTSFNDENVQVVQLHCIKPTIFMHIMYYIYKDSCELTESNVFEVLHAADMYLLPGLKRQCASVIGRYIDLENCVSILHTARLFNLPRLEDQCAEFVAGNVEKVLQLSEFVSLVREDAASVCKREETDSIPVIDDVRFHVTNYVQTFSDMYEADSKLVMIDRFLEDLNLDG